MDSSPETKDKKTDAISAKDKKLLYHLTPIKNVENILKEGLKPRNSLKKEDFKDTANLDIIDKRNKMGLTQYVPFHFISNGPYDGRVRKDNPNEDFAYICVSRSTIKDNCKIIVGHPLNNNSDKIYSWDEGMEEIDWTLMDKGDYTDEACKQMCMSEALYLGTITHENIQCIWVPSAQVGKCEEIKEKLNGKFYIDAKDFLMAENSKKQK